MAVIKAWPLRPRGGVGAGEGHPQGTRGLPPVCSFAVFNSLNTEMT